MYIYYCQQIPWNDRNHVLVCLSVLSSFPEALSCNRTGSYCRCQSLKNGPRIYTFILKKDKNKTGDFVKQLGAASCYRSSLNSHPTFVGVYIWWWFMHIWRSSDYFWHQDAVCGTCHSCDSVSHCSVFFTCLLFRRYQKNKNRGIRYIRL